MVGWGGGGCGATLGTTGTTQAEDIWNRSSVAQGLMWLEMGARSQQGWAHGACVCAPRTGQGAGDPTDLGGLQGRELRVGGEAKRGAAPALMVTAAGENPKSPKLEQKLLLGEKYPRCAPELSAKPGSKACPGGWAAPRDGHGHRGEVLGRSQAVPRDRDGPGCCAWLRDGEGWLPRAVYCPGDKAALFSSPGHPE